MLENRYDRRFILKKEEFVRQVNQENKSFFLKAYKNLIKTDDGFELKPVIEEEENGKIRFLSQYDLMDYTNHNCYCCEYFRDLGRFTECEFCSKLLKFNPPTFFKSNCINHCDAYSPIPVMSIIKTESDMIDFIEKTRNTFNCPEEYEEYFGFKRRWDEATGDISETTREYYNRGGKFTKIPDKYPCVIYFSVMDFNTRIKSPSDDHIQWIYIGE